MPGVVRSLPRRPACFRKAVFQPIAAAVAAWVRPRTLALAIATPLVLLLSQQQAAKAVNLNVGGVDYDVELYIGTYNANPGYFNLPGSGGRMPWWGNQQLAGDLAFALGDGLGPTPPAGQGPLFATSFDNTNVFASYFDLDTLGVTDTIIDGAPFDPGTSYSWVVLVNNDPAPVPAPLPLLGAAAAFSASRRLRHRIHLARTPRP